MAGTRTSATGGGLANLPGYDTAPDIYETPELTDDTSTTLQSDATARSPSPHSTSDDEEEGGDSSDGNNKGGIVSRRRLYPQRARTRFAAAKVDGRGVDLGDRVGGLRKGYKTVQQRDSRSYADGEESLDTRIARLRREVEECRILAARERDGNEDEESGTNGQVDELSHVLAELEAPSTSRRKRSQAPVAPAATTVAKVDDVAELDDSQVLGRVAAFDARLMALEKALGLSSLDAAATDAAGTYAAQPLLPSLDLLDQQLTALSSATSLTGLEAAASRFQKLKADSDTLLRAGGNQTNDEETDGAVLAKEDLQRLRTLHTLLPTMQSLAPTVPLLLARLRSLRLLHAGAASAAQDLDDMERRQREMENEIKSWKEALANVESAVAEGGKSNGRNGKVVEGWVRDLEARIKALG